MKHSQPKQGKIITDGRDILNLISDTDTDATEVVAVGSSSPAVNQHLY